MPGKTPVKSMNPAGNLAAKPDGPAGENPVVLLSGENPQIAKAEQPVLPGVGKDPDSRWVDVYEGQLDEAQMVDWIQAAAIPG